MSDSRKLIAFFCGKQMGNDHLFSKPAKIVTIRAIIHEGQQSGVGTVINPNLQMRRQGEISARLV